MLMALKAIPFFLKKLNAFENILVFNYRCVEGFFLTLRSLTANDR